MKRLVVLLVVAVVWWTGARAAEADDPPVVVVNVIPDRPELLVYESELVLLDARSSFDPDGQDLVRFEWFVNGARRSAGDVFFWRPDAGAGARQEVLLKIFDSGGLWSDDVRVFTVSPVAKRFYYLKDHLGSVRVTVDEFGNVVHYSDYYPFGMEMPKRVLENESPTVRFTGHQLDGESDLIYAGARYFDPQLVRWLTPDPLADEYPGWSPYNYALNNPVSNYDPDGNYVVFINGWYTQYYTALMPASIYWKGFDNEIMKSYPDEGRHYVDGSLGGIYNTLFMRNNSKLYNLDSHNRYSAGYNKGAAEAEYIKSQLAEGETVKIVSHSMGGAFGIGYARALADLGIDVEFHLAIAPYNANDLDTGDILTFQVGDEDDVVSRSPDLQNAITLPKRRVNSRLGIYKFNLNPVLRHLIRDYDPQQIMNELEDRLYPEIR